MTTVATELDLRDAPAGAPVLALDLARSTQSIHRDLRDRFPHAVLLWWELDTGEQSGRVYNRTRLLAHLIHAKTVDT